MSLDEMTPRLQAVHRELVNSTPDDAPGASLSIRVTADGDSPRVSIDVRAAGGQKLEASATLRVAIREWMDLMRRSGAAFEVATHCVYADGDAWATRYSCGYPDGGRPQGRPQREGDRWPTTFQELLEQHLVVSLFRQRRLAAAVEDSPWKIDLEAARLRFPTANREFEIALLGSAGHRTWLWAWASRHFAGPIVAAARRLRECGDQWGVVELLAAEIPLDDREGHAYAAVATGVLGFDAYYRCPYEGGSAWVLVRDASLAAVPLATPLDLAPVFVQMTQMGWVRHRAAIRWAATNLGLRVESASDGSMRLEFPDGAVIRSEFDASDRLTKVSGPSARSGGS